jgi:hypothetical protein
VTFTGATPTPFTKLSTGCHVLVTDATYRESPLTQQQFAMSNFDAIDWELNPRPQTPDFTAMMERTNRRGFMGMTAAAAGVLTFLSGSQAGAADKASPSIGFKAVPASSADSVVVPEGYEWAR